MLGGKNTAVGVFPFQFFFFLKKKIFFSVACLVDCKLVRYCNIDVFLLVSHFLSCSDCSNLSEDVMNNAWMSTFLWSGLVERYGAIVNRKKNVR